MALGTSLIPGYPFWLPSDNAIAVVLFLELTGNLTSLSMKAGVQSCYDFLVIPGCLFDVKFIERSINQLPNNFCDSSPPFPSPAPPSTSRLFRASCNGGTIANTNLADIQSCTTITGDLVSQPI
mmetsp:Transcript_9607/g.29239  ORF Transcript_9607/g.29239 Transcript_9607/m.29239 type:complete len:124 (-) Transcript_9607:362-733(-)